MAVQKKYPSFFNKLSFLRNLKKYHIFIENIWKYNLTNLGELSFYPSLNESENKSMVLTTFKNINQEKFHEMIWPMYVSKKFSSRKNRISKFRRIQIMENIEIQCTTNVHHIISLFLELFTKVSLWFTYKHFVFFQMICPWSAV